MLNVKDLLECETMPKWADISLMLYKDFSLKYLISTVFRYHLEGGIVIDVHFTEWSIYHLLGIQHINGKINKSEFFDLISNGMDFDTFQESSKMRKRFFDMKYRIRSFACIYKILTNESMFYVPAGAIKNGNIPLSYLKYSLIDGKGVCLGVRKMDGVYTAYTLIVDRSSHATKTIDDLVPVKINKIELIKK